MTWSSSTTRTGASLTLEPMSPVSLSTVRTSSTDAFSCLPPQRTIAYTEVLSLPCAGPPRDPRSRSTVARTGSPALLAIIRGGAAAGFASCADPKEYQTERASNGRRLGDLRLPTARVPALATGPAAVATGPAARPATVATRPATGLATGPAGLAPRA